MRVEISNGVVEVVQAVRLHDAVQVVINAQLDHFEGHTIVLGEHNEAWLTIATVPSLAGRWFSLIILTSQNVRVADWVGLNLIHREKKANSKERIEGQRVQMKVCGRGLLNVSTEHRN